MGSGAPDGSPARDAQGSKAACCRSRNGSARQAALGWAIRDTWGCGSAGAACVAWNMIDSGDYSITDFVSEK